MVPNHKRRCTIGICVAVVIAIDALRYDPVNRWLLAMAAISWFWAMSHFAASKGYHRAWGILFGLVFPCFGLWSTALMRIFPTQETLLEPPSQKNAQTGPVVAKQDDIADLGREAKY